MFDVSLLLTVGLIFLVTLLGSYLRSRRKDPCLKSFEGFHITLELTNNKVVWGFLELESTGLELRYRDDIQDEKHLESSYILYAQEYKNIQALYRFADELTAENRRKRDEDIRRSFHPGFWERAKRDLRRFIGTASDSLNEVIGLLVGRVKKPAGRYITDTGETYLNRFGANLIGYVGGVFDPLLERYIGQKVVVEVMEDDEVHEHVGIFKNYSPDFIEVLDVQFPQKQAVEVGPEGCDGNGCVTATLDGQKLRVSNPKQQPVLLHSMAVDGEEQLLGIVIDSGETVELHVQPDFEHLELNVRVVRVLDMVVPRTRSLVRHRAERFKPDILPEIIFDVGFILNPGGKMAAQERKLRQRLDRHPTDALAAANLGALLMQQRKYDEAEKWLHHALTMRYSLPDNGRRAEMQLREAERRREKQQVPAQMTTQSSLPSRGEDRVVDKDTATQAESEIRRIEVSSG